MNGLAYLKNTVTGEIYNTKTKIHTLTSTDNIEFCISEKFNSANWNKEPEESLIDLYAKRSQQIRDMYDYIILYFSGGSDSITALNAFVKNNIPIDEVVIYINSDTVEPKLSGQYAIDYLKKINYEGYVNIIDLNFETLNKIINEETWRQYECFSGLLHSFQRFQVSFFEENNYVIGKNRIGNIGNIFGGTFPYVLSINDVYMSRISIHSFTMIASSYYKNVYFFTDENMPEVFIKQSYILARHMKNNNILFSSENVKELKLLIRDEYNENVINVKDTGDTTLKFQKDSSSSLLLTQNMMLYLLYKDKIEFLKKCVNIRKEMNNFDLSIIKDFYHDYQLNLD